MGKIKRNLQISMARFTDQTWLFYYHFLIRKQ